MGLAILMILDVRGGTKAAEGGNFAILVNSTFFPECPVQELGSRPSATWP
jgi:hypothetical protein